MKQKYCRDSVQNYMSLENCSKHIETGLKATNPVKWTFALCINLFILFNTITYMCRRVNVAIKWQNKADLCIFSVTVCYCVIEVSLPKWIHTSGAWLFLPTGNIIYKNRKQIYIYIYIYIYLGRQHRKLEASVSLADGQAYR